MVHGNTNTSKLRPLWDANYCTTDHTSYPVYNTIIRDSSVGIATGYGLDGNGFDSRHEYHRRAWLWRPPGLISSTYRHVKLTIHNHLVPSTEMEETYLHASYVSIVRCLIKHRDKITFHFHVEIYAHTSMVYEELWNLSVGLKWQSPVFSGILLRTRSFLERWMCASTSSYALELEHQSLKNVC
jgi:hypothetical protein